MVEKKVIIKNPTGLHLRPAGLLCKTAAQFQSEVKIYIRNNETNAKSVLSVLGACIVSGEEITLRCAGEDEVEALDSIVELIESGLGE